MITLNIERTSLAKFERDMATATKKMHRKALLKAIKPAANIMRNVIKARTPVRTGLMKRSIKVRVMRGADNAPYARYAVDFGQSKAKKTKKSSKPFYAIMVHNGTIVVSGEKRKHRSVTDAERQRRMSAGGQVRIKPNPWVYEAFEATAQKAAERIIEGIKNEL